MCVSCRIKLYSIYIYTCSIGVSLINRRNVRGCADSEESPDHNWSSYRSTCSNSNLSPHFKTHHGNTIIMATTIQNGIHLGFKSFQYEIE